MQEFIPLSPETRAQLAQVAVPTIVSLLWKRGYRNMMLSGPQPLNPGAVKFVGPAYTVRTIPAREDLQSELSSGLRPSLQGQSVDEIPPGAVLAVAMGGETRTAFMGDIMTTFMKVKGVAGVVLDGGVSDRAAIAAIDLPVFAMGSAGLPVTSHRFVIDLNQPIELAGVAVLPGDVLMGDANGVVVIPRALIDELAAEGYERELLEQFVITRVQQGAPLKGTYPPNAQTLAAYEQMRAARQKGA